MGTICAKCGSEMEETDRTTLSGSDVRTFTCPSCGDTADIVGGTATWQAMAEGRSEEDAEAILDRIQVGAYPLGTFTEELPFILRHAFANLLWLLVPALAALPVYWLTGHAVTLHVLGAGLASLAAAGLVLELGLDTLRRRFSQSSQFMILMLRGAGRVGAALGAWTGLWLAAVGTGWEWSAGASTAGMILLVGLRRLLW